MFSYVDWIPKMFPKFSDYDLLRDLAMKFYDSIEVFITFSTIDCRISLDFLSIRFLMCIYFPLYSKQMIIDEQYKTYDSNHKRHFLDMYFKKIEQTSDNPKTTHSCKLNCVRNCIATWPKLLIIRFGFFFHFTDKQLVRTMVDLLFATFVADATQMQFLLQRFCLQPEILEKCQNEIDRVVGHSRLPTLDDRMKLVKLEIK